jgi:hypothetical protein
VIEILDARGASLRRYVDRALLRTRYYPRRVLAVGPRRYEVPSAPPADGARQIRLEEVPPMRPLTVPRLRATARPLGEPQDLHELRSGRLAWRSAFFEAEILEQVDGLRAADGTELVYAPVESVYRSRVRGIFFPSAPPPRVLQHLARALDGVLGALFFLEDDDAHVAAVPAGLPPSLPPGLLVVDRHLGGMGLAEALDDDAVRAALRWVRAVLAACPCANGCARCTPEITLAEGPAKAGVIEVLGG